MTTHVPHRTSLRHERLSPRAAATLLALAGLGVAVTLASLAIGALPLSLGTLWRALTLGPFGADGSAVTAAEHAVLWHIRMPRIGLGIATGAALAVSGAALQGIFRNPLADPGLIGVTGGAAVGAVTVIGLGVASLPAVSGLSGSALVAAGAFGGAVLVTTLVYRTATRNGRTSVTTMLLAGIAINALAGTVIGVFTYASSDTQLRNITLWTLGSLAGATWAAVALACVGALLGLWLIWRDARALDLLQLGEREAWHVGVDVDRLKRRVVWVSALAVGGAVAFAGVIGFVGLVVPHIVRLLLGPSHRLLVPASALLGGALLLGADLLARTVVAPAELPIGIVTAALGAPFFLALVVAQRSREWT